MMHSQVETAVREFEGLVHETARQIVEVGVELDFDDVRQYLRIKVWRAVQRFDVQRAAAAPQLGQARDRYGRSPLQRYVFICVANERKDIEKRPRRFNRSIDELRDDAAAHGRTDAADTQQRANKFDAKYLSVDRDSIYGEVEGDDDLDPVIEHLTPIERQVVELRLRGRMLCEIDRELGLSRAQRERVLRSVREKLAGVLHEHGPRTAPMRPLPGAALQPSQARAPLAA